MKRRRADADIRLPSKNNFVAAVAVVLCATVLAGCADLGPKPWERDLMATRPMQVDPHPMQSAMDDHIYFSKEASSGGGGFAGGGCGCN